MVAAWPSVASFGARMSVSAHPMLTVEASSCARGVLLVGCALSMHTDR